MTEQETIIVGRRFGRRVYRLPPDEVRNNWLLLFAATLSISGGVAQILIGLTPLGIVVMAFAAWPLGSIISHYRWWQRRCREQHRQADAFEQALSQRKTL